MRTTQQLSALAIGRLKEPGYYSDGGNLFLQVTTSGAKSWIFRYGKNGKKHEMGLGPLHTVSLAMAREKALQCRLQILEGLDPLAKRKEIHEAISAANARRITFKECAEKLIDSKRAGWKNAKHAQQWENTLNTYAYPFIGTTQVSDVDTAAVRKCLDPIWTTKTETANRVRQRIEMIIDWAKAHGHRTGDNPAAWRGHLEAVMAAPDNIRKRDHHAALDVDAMPAFIATLRAHPGTSARALDFLILTASRTNEVIGATWPEIDFDKATWTIPAERMKAKIAHTVPLSAPALAVLKQAETESKGTAFIFPGRREGRPLSNMAMLELLRGMGTKDANGEPATVHGFRSTFRQWAAERTTHPREVAEHALAHRLPDKVEAAYQRSTLFVKRRSLMNDWATFLVNN
ncbi:tyrosine-type recombinase/integrase [Noviherbaspirillum sedimenti]|uniref:Site-specific integrase n=1 Tax=Noviherbaspirillum sedimenti TaxID=2320865 RepID=A0A3A3FX97_9BURK|nr:site-specific integrase [Noviherbaspirillum sedimenti]RJG00344.1 site-specific integrase [Noviherbaspirillum sedimenti]